LPKRNYQYDKRQKELAKQKKKDEKRQRKLDKNDTAPEEAPAGQDDPPMSEPTDQ